HIYKNLEKNLKGKLHEEYLDFIAIWNKTQKYLECALGIDVTSWVLCYTHRSFNNVQIQLQLNIEDQYEYKKQINQNPTVGLPNI
ncbi:45954_t:CDS:2, partial [Gigaspora margarita]